MPRKRPITRTIMAPIPPIPPTAIGMPPPPRRSSIFSLSRSPIHRMAILDTELQYLITPAKDCVIKHQHDDRSDNRHEPAVEVETSHASSANSGKEEASDNRSDYAKSNVEKETLTGLLLTILLPITPAIRPSTIQPMIDM